MILKRGPDFLITFNIINKPYISKKMNHFIQIYINTNQIKFLH